jgi:ADP-ribose pyrophosphatase YjhB (NUDIX family)
MKTNQIEVKALCIILRDNKEILVGLGYDEIKKEHFGRIMGGGMNFGETAEVAVRREIKEELLCEIENLEFIKLIENIFTYNGEKGHQITFLYKGELANKDLYTQEKIAVHDTKSFEAEWLSLDDVISGKVKLYPEFDLSLLAV